MKVPFFRPELNETEIGAVVEVLRSGWLTTGKVTKQFETQFAEYVGAKHAVSVTSCTAAMHLALEAMGIGRGDLVLVPTMTFAATAEVVRYFDATPVFVDCDPVTLCIDVEDARRRASDVDPERLKAIIPVHYGGQMCDVAAVRQLADELGLAVLEDAAHTLPAAYRKDASSPWQAAGTTGDITAFSFYANKCITTGEGGMAVTDDDDMAARMRVMSLHGMSKDAWRRYSEKGAWYYEVIAPGFKYNTTDMAAALGVNQLARADELLADRRRVVARYLDQLAPLDAYQLPVELENRQHSWHLFPLRLHLDRLRIDRNKFIDELTAAGIGCSVHWMPLHLQPYYVETQGLSPEAFPVAAAEWQRLISLPLFPAMTDDEIETVVSTLHRLAREHAV